MAMRMLIVFLGLWLLWTGVGFAAQETKKEGFSVAGDWQIRDYETKQPSTIIHIWKAQDYYFGKIKKIYPNQPNPIIRCFACKGPKHNAPILGLVILEGLIDQGNHQYAEGRILDPRSGKIYRCKATLSDDGMQLKVRGYVGFSLIGATDTWVRRPAGGNINQR